jgi:hypothetical protein
MRTLGVIVLGVALVGGVCCGQNLPEPQQLRAAQDDIGYAELLNAAAFTDEQLGALQEVQAQLEAAGLVGPDLATVLTKVLAGVLVGMSVPDAQAALGEQQQVLQQAQQRWQQALQQATDQLQKLLTDEQKDALIWFGSPAHALDGVVDAVSQMRGLPEAQWTQVRPQITQALSQMSPGGGATPEKIGELLDQVRAMDEATFEAQRGTLAQTWLPTLLPNVAQMLQTPQFRQQQLTQVCQRLLAYERGATIVGAKREAGAGP